MRAAKTSAIPQGDTLAWWRQARFGLFIHWGLYAIPAGIWQGRRVPYAGEWLMFREKIPAETYARLAARFRPRRWDAAAIVRLAKDAGMGYLVVTAKHHDGFAMYDSAVSAYNVRAATPWRHDPLADLATECRRQGIPLCFYYSQDLDWHHPDGAWNDWDFSPGRKNSGRYLREKVLPQLTELLTHYGPVGMIWFDMPLTLSRAQCAVIRRHVKRLQPRCLISGRIGHGLGDFRQLRDNYLPPGRLDGDWEACATLNHTWGFKRHDHAWKSAANLITTLVDLASKGANYLLNIGPDADGAVPAPSVNRLRAVGAWLQVNGASVRNTSPSPFKHDFPWGRITTAGRTLYFHLFGRPKKNLCLYGLHTRVKRVSALADRRRRFPFRQSVGTAGIPELAIDFSGLKQTKPVTVIAVELTAVPDVAPQTLQQPDGALTFIGPMARVGSGTSKPSLRIGGNGLTENWRNTSDYLEWDFTVLQPGTYHVDVVTTHQHVERWSGGHTLRLICDGQGLRRVTRRDALLPGLRSVYYPQIATRFGVLHLTRAGNYLLRLKADRLRLAKKNTSHFSDGGIQFSEIRLTAAT